MVDTEQLEQSRAALQMINPAPYNAEAPREALHGDTTPTDFHYVRSNFDIPQHDGTFTIGGAVENPITLTLADLQALPAIERSVTLECAGNGRLEMRPLPTGEPWGDYAVSTARWTGARLTDVLALAAPDQRRCRRTFRRRRQWLLPAAPGPGEHGWGRPDVREGTSARTRRRPRRRRS